MGFKFFFNLRILKIIRILILERLEKKHDREKRRKYELTIKLKKIRINPSINYNYKPMIKLNLSVGS